MGRRTTCESGVFAHEAVDLLRVVGAPLHADVLARANRIAWPTGRIPAAESARRFVLSTVKESRYDDVDSQWDAAEHQEQPLDTLIERHVRRHPSAFFS